MKENSKSEITAAVEGLLTQMRARKYAPSTIDNRTKSLRPFTRYLAAVGVERLQDIDPGLLRRYRSDQQARGLAVRTIFARLHVVRQLFEWLAAELILFENPAAELPLPKVPKALPRVISVEQVRKLLQAPKLSRICGLRDRAVLEMLYGAALRAGELAALTVFDVDAERESVRVLGKGGKERVLPLGKQASRYLARYLELARPRYMKKVDPDTAALWLTERGQPFQADTVLSLVKAHTRSAGLPDHLSPHTLRRSCATHMLVNGAHPLMVAAMLGHANLETLSHYLRVTVGDLRNMHRSSAPGQ